MVAGLSTQTVPPGGQPTDPRPLRALTTRAADDGTLALIDAWAATCDVLAFYGERILNEGYLGTAEERLSVIEIGRMLGYEPSPGVAASTRLAFTAQVSALAPVAVDLAPGVAVMSVPPEGKLPQVFETVEAVRARAEYNALAPRLTRPFVLGPGTHDVVWLAGVSTRLEPGHVLIISAPERRTNADATWNAVRVVQVDIDAAAQRTRVRFSPQISGFSPAAAPIVIAFRQRAGIFGWNAPDFDALSSELKGSYLNKLGTDLSLVFSIVGFVDQTSGLSFVVPLVKAEWPNFNVGAPESEPTNGVHLDRETDLVAPGSWVYLTDDSQSRLGQVTDITTVGRVDWTLTGRVTAVTFDGTTPAMSTFDRRSTAVHIGSTELALAQAPIDTPVSGLQLELGVKVSDMEPGRTLLIRGVPVGESQTVVYEAVVTMSATQGDVTVLTLQDSLPALERASVVIWGNTALATHGTRVGEEAVGSGDATVPNQRFALRQAPLTWVSAPTAMGAKPTLEVRVQGILWKHVESLYTAAPSDRVYTLELDEGGSAQVVFGDGVRGARLPSGQDNVVVSYRKGMGLDGEVGANLLTLLQTRPIGLFGVNNPAPATGAADPESIDDARTNAPLKVLTLDRLVSLSDYGDFARAFAGVGKARATQLWDGRRAFIQLTVASASGQSFLPGDEVLVSLQSAIEQLGDPTHVVQVAGHDTVQFKVQLKLAVDAKYVRADVEAAVRQALVEGYGFAARDFGQPVVMSGVAALVHGVAGVIAVDIDYLWIGPTVELSPVLRAALPKWTGSSVSKAQLLLLDPEAIDISEMQP